jgi:hypothetical protein
MIILHTHVQQILELIDDRIAALKEQIKLLPPKSPGLHLHLGALDELHYIKNDIEEMFGES